MSGTVASGRLHPVTVVVRAWLPLCAIAWSAWQNRDNFGWIGEKTGLGVPPR